MGRVVQAAFQTVSTEGMSAGRAHGLIKQPAGLGLGLVLVNARPLHSSNGRRVWRYLMQRAHSKSLGSSRSLETVLQLFSFSSCCSELLATPEIKKGQSVS